MDEVDLDTLLAAIGNPTRRRILRKLVKETHYPLQLSKELSVSQRAIMKHLKVLEDSDLVSAVFMESAAGPPRKCYVATKRFTLVIDLSPELFNEELRFHGKDDVIEGEADTSALRNAENLRLKLAEFMAHMEAMNLRLEELSDERDEILSRKEHAMHYANDIIDTLCEDYDERKVLRHIVAEDDISLESMSEHLDMRESEIERIMKKLEKKGLLMLAR
ncbi:MAG: helix-turn-helix domain-containing protein [Thermoplasmata archaeon]